MIGFGELRKRSIEWQIDLAEVERAHAIDWLLKGLFDDPVLGSAIVLRGSSALRYAHCADYPFADDPEFLVAHPIDSVSLTESVNAAANASGLKFSLVDFEQSSAKVEYTGPLGRRSAAQPRITLSFIAGETRIDSVRVPLIHRFSDACAAMMTAISLTELVAERVAILAASPRARDVFDVWFIVTHAREQIAMARVKTLAQEIAQSKKIALPQTDALFNPSHRKILERGWENALCHARYHPTFVQVEQELVAFAETMLRG